MELKIAWKEADLLHMTGFALEYLKILTLSEAYIQIAELKQKKETMLEECTSLMKIHGGT